MDFKTLKLNLIAFLAEIQNGTMLNKIESHLFKRQTLGNETSSKAGTFEEFNDRIEKI